MSIEVVPCSGHRGAVDIVDSRNSSDIDPLHVSLAEWTEFVTAVKGGRYDDVAIAVETSAGRAHSSQ